MVAAGEMAYATIHLNEGSIGISPEDAIISPMYTVFRVDTSQVEPKYLERFLKSPTALSEYSVMGNGSVHRRAAISFSRLGKLRVPLPSLSEQRRIVETLDKVDAIRAKRREATAKLDQLMHSVFFDMFGDPASNAMDWNRVQLAELLDRIDSGTSPVCLDRPAIEGEWAVLKLGSVTRCIFDPGENKAMIPSTKFDRSLEVREGDLLFSRKNTHSLVAACAFVDRTPARLLLPDLIFRLVLKPGVEVSKIFLHALLSHPSKRAEIQKLADGSAGSMPNISKAKLLSSKVELPPIQMQLTFERRVSAIGRLRAAAAESEAALARCFTSIQSTAFPE